MRASICIFPRKSQRLWRTALEESAKKAAGPPLVGGAAFSTADELQRVAKRHHVYGMAADVPGGMWSYLRDKLGKVHRHRRRWAKSHEYALQQLMARN